MVRLVEKQVTLFSLIGENRRLLIAIIPLIIGMSFFSTYPIKLIQQVVDIAVTQTIPLPDKVKGILIYGALYLGTFILCSLSGFFLNYLRRKAETDTGHRLRCRLFQHLMYTSREYFVRKKAGDLAADLLKDSEITTGTFLKPITYISNSIMKFCIGLILMLSIDWRMTLFVFPLGIFSSLLIRKTGGRMKKLTVFTRDYATLMWGFFTEAIRGSKEIQANNAQEYMFNKFENKSINAADAFLAETIYSRRIDAYNSLFSMSVIGLIMIFGALLVARGELSVGGLTAFMMYNGMLVDPVIEFITFYQELKRVDVSIDRLNRVFQAPTAGGEKETLVTAQGNISFNNVSFSYDQNIPVLKDIEINIPAGSKTAIVGRSGSGKTTLASLLVGFYQPAEGELVVDGITLNERTISWVRKHMAVCFQDTFLFNDTIEENLRIIKPKACKSEIEKAVNIACLEPVIQSCPEGLQTIVGENGSYFSGGERQRIGIARAILRGSPILLLDEAISVLDSITTTKLISNINIHLHDKTVIMIAHKLTSVQAFEHIIVMKEGKVEAQGTHDYLLSSSSEYKTLYERQFVET